MHLTTVRSYLRRGLLIILGFLVVSTLAAMIYLAHTLLGLRTLISDSSKSVATALVLQDIVINLQDAQAGVKGYILTGDPYFLQAYDSGKAHVPTDLNMLKQGAGILVTPSERQTIIDLTNKRLSVADQHIQLYNSQGYGAAQAAIANREGEDVMSSLRNLITTISSRDLQDIGPMQRRSQQNVRIALAVAATMAVLILCTCVAIVWYFRWTVLHERALESTKNEFLSLASHQLRTPATNVKQYVALLLDGYMGDITEQQRHALEVAYKNNEAEIRIMNTLLDVAKLDLDRIELHKKVTNLAAAVRRAVRDYKPIAREAGLTIKIDTPTQLMATIDEGYIEGVLGNLLDNAIKYSRPNTRITVKVWREEDYACFSVRDQGVGIRKRDLGRLFTKFTRLDNEFSANSQGSGLGLYWVKKVIQLHSGKVELSSREGVGSVFIVRVPVR